MNPANLGRDAVRVKRPSVTEKVNGHTSTSNMVATSHVELVKLKLKLVKIKQNWNFSFLIALVTFQVLNSHMW